MAYLVDREEDGIARSLKNIQDNSGIFNPEQMACWAKACSLMDKQGMPLRQLMCLTNIVRRRAARISEAEKEKERAAATADKVTA